MHFDWLKSLRTPIRRRAVSLSSVVHLEPRHLLTPLPIATETAVNVDQFATGLPVIASSFDGSYVIVWEYSESLDHGSEIYARQFDSHGIPIGPQFRVNSTTTDHQRHPAIAMDSDGDYVIAWDSFNQDGDKSGVYAQRFNSLGLPQGSEFQVNSTTSNNQQFPAVAMDAVGNSVIVWQDIGTTSIIAQRYNAAGDPLGNEFKVNSHSTGGHYLASIAMDHDGDFVVAWTSSVQDGNKSGIYAQRFDNLGNPQGSEFRVNSTTTDEQHYSDIGMDAVGNFVIIWHSYIPTNVPGTIDLDILGQRYNQSGVPLGSDFKISSDSTKIQAFPDIAMNANGDFVVSWTDVKQVSVDTDTVARQYRADGSPLSAEFRVNSTTSGFQGDSAVGIDSSHNFVVAWDGSGNDPTASIYLQRYRSSQPDNLGAWRSSRFYLDSNRNNAWNGSTTDTLNTFGSATDKPLTGDWNGDGYTDIGVWRAGTFYLDANGNGLWDGASTDKTFKFGLAGDTPLVGDWNGDGIDDIGAWRTGKFYLDLDRNQAWNSALDGIFTFGAATDTPLIGDWDADNKDDLGVWRAGKFYLDYYPDRRWIAFTDRVYSFGLNTDTPLIGDWNGDGTDDLGVWRAGKFYQDTNGNRAWNSATDTVTTFGSSTDTPLIGYWRPKSIPGSPPAASPLPPNTILSTPIPPVSTPTTQVSNTSVLATLIATPAKRRDLAL